MERFEGNGRMSKAVSHNGILYLCGQTYYNPEEPTKNVKEQTAQVLEKIEALLNKYGSDKNHILSATIYLKNIADFADMNSVWDAWVENGHEPARACVEANMAREEILVEITITAAQK